MNINRGIRFCLFGLFVISSTLPAFAVTIKIGSIAPERSPWGKALLQLAREWAEISGGDVRLQIFPGGIVGNESDVIRKMRLGYLGGAVISNRGFTRLNRDIYALNTPLLITDESELNFLMEKMGPIFQQQIEQNGYKVIVFSMAGWLHFFSKDPLYYPEDLKKHKVAFTVDEPEMEQAWKKSGYHIVPTDLKDTMMSLQSGMVNAIYTSPLLAGSGQYFTLAPHMTAQRIAPLIGGIVLDIRVWNKIPDQFKEKMTAAALRMTQELAKASAQLEKEAVDTMKEHGLKVVPFPAGALDKWRQASNLGMDQLIGKAFSQEVYQQIIDLLKQFRDANTGGSAAALKK